MQIDTGSAQSIMPYYVYTSLNCQQPLKRSKNRFASYTNHQLEVKGCITLPVEHKDNYSNVKFYVVNVADKLPLLSGGASSSLQLIKIDTQHRPVSAAQDTIWHTTRHIFTQN